MPKEQYGGTIQNTHESYSSKSPLVPSVDPSMLYSSILGKNNKKENTLILEKKIMTIDRNIKNKKRNVPCWRQNQ